MSNLDTALNTPTTGSHTVDSTPADTRGAHTPSRRISTETKASFKTTELVAYVVVAIAVLVAAAVTDVSDFGAQEAWFYVTLLTIGYLVSRGLAKSGSRDYFDDNADSSHNAR